MSEPTLFSSLEGSRVDRAAGIIYGVRLITRGPAKGHELEIDDQTVTTLHQLGLKMPSGIKTKLNHRSGVTDINGRIFNPRIEGGDWFGDWELDKAHPSFESVCNLAEKQPHNVGFSLSCDNADGGHEKRGKKRFARFKAINSADLVDAPAANPGLFEVPSVDSRKKAMTDEQFSELKSLVEKQGKAQTDLCEEVGKMKSFFEAIQKEVETEGKTDTEEKTEMSEIKTAMTELAVKFTAMEEALKGKGQQAAKSGDERTDLSVKTAEETALQTKLTKAKTDLEAARGLSRYQLAGKIEKEFGAAWKTKLTQLEAKK
jgi:hypothetical protein